MPKKQIAEFLERISDIPPEEAAKVLALFLEYRREAAITKREIKRYDAIKEVMIQEISQKYDFYQDLFTKIFAERKEVIDKNFEIIDRGLKAGDHNLVSAALSSLSNVAASGPITRPADLRLLPDTKRKNES
jgi:hypothetical protein